MTCQTNSAQAVLTDLELLDVGAKHGRPSAALLPMWRAVESAVLSKLRAPVSDIREGFELTYAADADDPACASDLSHFTNGWRACIASQMCAPAAGEAQPAAYLTLDEEGSPCMLFFDVVEARRYCALGEAPEPLFRHAALQACAERLVRYCPGCGSVGPVEGNYRDCCPDGGEARMIPAPLAEKCRDTFKIAVKALRADAAANEAMANQVPAVTEEYTLRAMARNYTDRHSWDKLDSKAITAAADEIRALRAALAARAQLPERGDAHD